jgi:hypothetical protein
MEPFDFPTDEARRPVAILMWSQIKRILSDLVRGRVKLSTDAEKDFYCGLAIFLAEHTKDPEFLREILMLWARDDSS